MRLLYFSNDLTRKILLLLVFIVGGIRAAQSQVSISGPQCVSGGTQYTYNISAFVSGNVTVFVTNGTLSTGGSSVTHAPGSFTVLVTWNTGFSSGSVNVSSGTLVTYSVSAATALTGGTISSGQTQTINYNTTPAAINCSAATGGCTPATYNYQWQSSPNNTTFTDISGATSLNLTFSTGLTQTTYYRRKVTEVTSGGIVYSATATVTVYPQLLPGTITPASVYIAPGLSPGTLTGTAASGGNGVYTYGWESSPDGVTWTAISATNTLNYTPPVLTVTTYYRRSVTSNGLPAYTAAVPVYVGTGVPAAGNTTGNTNSDVNWVIASTYDPSGNLIGQGKVFYDNAGKQLQSQSKAFYRKNPTTVYTHVLATEPIYDVFGGPAASTLSAPINSSEFMLSSTFVSATDGSDYTYKNFDRYNPSGTETDKTNNPDPVGGQSTVGTLGWYYGSNNNWEPYTPTTNYPYTRQNYYKDGTGTVKKSTGAGETFKMGSGKEMSSFTMPVLNQLDHYIQVRNKYFTTAEVGALPTDFKNDAVQLVSRDPNGVEVITIQDKSGKLLMSARPGTDLVTTNTISLSSYAHEINIGYTITGATIQLQSVAGTGNIIVIQKSTTNTTLYSGPASGFTATATVSGYITVQGDASFIVSYTATDAPVNQGGSGLSFSCTACSSSYSTLTGLCYFKILADATPVTITGGTYTLYDMNTEAATTLIGGTTLNKGFYKLVAGAYNISLTYTNNYTDISYGFYNQLGQLVASISPEGVKKLLGTGINNYATKASVPFISLYQYNTKGQLISAATPDGGTSKFVYRKDGKLRFSQNAQQAASGRFSYTNYDKYGRAVESGEYSGTIAFTNDMSIASTMKTILEDVTATGGLTGGTQYDVVKTKYEVPDNSHGLAGYVQDVFNLRNGVSMTEKYSSIVNNAPVAANRISQTWYNYDEEGKVLWTIKNIAAPTGSAAFGAKTVDYTYDALGHVIKKVYQKNTAAETFVHYYEYDPANQNLWKVYTNTVDNTTTRTLHATYIYYLHGGLKRIELATNLQGIDYTYTLQGTLKAINNADKPKDPGQDGAGNGFATDVFGMVLDYFPNDYQNSRTAGIQTIKGVNTTAIVPTESYAGNIKAMTWFSEKPSGALGVTNAPITNVFVYDNKYQFIENTWGTGLNFTNTPATFTATGNFKEKMKNYSTGANAYDANGNITWLQRFSGTGTLTDNFQYSYLTNTNKLQTVTNTAPATNAGVYGSYAYDLNGQVVSETTALPTNQTKYIKYDVSGKVVLVTRDAAFTQKVVEYVYDELGERIMKKTYNASFQLLQVTYYTGDAVYTQPVTGGTTYGAIAINENPVQGASGRLGIYYRTAAVYAYPLTDHLGNTRAVITKNVSTYEVKEYADYYPYGSITSNYVVYPYRYGYQGEYAEKDAETNWNAFDLRMYDSRIGRWLQFDPAGQYYSPYVGMGNMPISILDPTGGEGDDWFAIKNADGSISMYQDVGNTALQHYNPYTDQTYVNVGGDNLTEDQAMQNAKNLFTFNYSVPLTTIGATLATNYSNFYYNGTRWYSFSQNKFYSTKFYGNQYTKGGQAAAKSTSKIFTRIGWGFGAWAAYDINNQYMSGEIGTKRMLMEQSMNTYSTFGGVYGAAAGVGWEAGRMISKIPWYRENVRPLIQDFFGWERDEFPKSKYDIYFEQ